MKFIITHVLCYYIVTITTIKKFTMHAYNISIVYLKETITVNILPSYDVHLLFTANVFSSSQYVIIDSISFQENNRYEPQRPSPG